MSLDQSDFISWKLARLELLVPPGFEVALGYNADTDILAFFWEFGGLYCDDGVDIHPVNLEAWSTWTCVAQVAQALDPFDLRCPIMDCDHCLVLFTEPRTLAVGFYNETAPYLRGPRSKAADVPYNPAQAHAAQQAAHRSLLSWLETH